MRPAGINSIFLQLVILSGLLAGCAHTPTAPAQKGIAADAGAAPSLPTFRYARKQDVELDILDVKPGPDGFPVASIFVRNLTDDTILITYGPKALLVHCGPFVQAGPGATIARRQEILGGFDYVEFAPVVGQWSQQSPQGGAELLLPRSLPPGRYELWATLKISGPREFIVESAHQPYELPRHR